MNKKASYSLASTWPFWVLFGVVIAVLFIAFGFTNAVYKNKVMEVPPELQEELIVLRFTNSPDCFAYVDENTNRTFAGRIDLIKFTEETLNSCYLLPDQTGKKKLNFRLKLEFTGNEITTNKYYYNDKDSLTLRKEVLVKRGDQFVKDTLLVYVQEKVSI